MDEEAALDLRLVVGQRELRRKLQIGAEILRLDMRIDLEAPPMGVVHQEQRSAVICPEIAGADVLAVAAKVRDRQRCLVEHADEAGRAAAVLHIRPAALRDGRHIEAVALSDERRLGCGKTVRRAVSAEVRPEFAAAIGLLRGAHAGSRGDVEESVSHSCKPTRGNETWRPLRGLDRAYAACSVWRTGKSISVCATLFRKLVNTFSATSPTISTICASPKPASLTAAISAPLTPPRVFAT